MHMTEICIDCDCYVFFRTWFHSSTRRQYFGFLLWDMAVTSLKIIVGPWPIINAIGPREPYWTALIITQIQMLYKREIKVVPVQAMKAYSESRDITPHILNLGCGWRWLANFTARPLYPRERTLYLVQLERLWWSQSRSGDYGEKYPTQCGEFLARLMPCLLLFCCTEHVAYNSVSRQLVFVTFQCKSELQHSLLWRPIDYNTIWLPRANCSCVCWFFSFLLLSQNLGHIAVNIRFMKVRTPLLPGGFVVPDLVFLIWKTIFHIFHSVHYNSNQQMHTVLLTAQYYNTPASTSVGPQW
jgi:hypothetical protein